MYKNILSTYKTILSKYKGILSKYISILSKYKKILSRYSSILSKYKSTLSKYKSILSKCRVTFGTLARNSGSRNPVLGQVPSKPREQNLTPRNPSNTETFETSGLQPFEPGTMPRVRNPVSGKWFRKLNPEPVPGTRFLPGTAPARPEHTEIYIVQRPHSILLLGNKLRLTICWV